jgi:hypothetical protein
MGLVYADIELINGDDLALVRRHIIGEDEIKRMQVKMLVDTGREYMCINETVQEQLQLPIVEKKKASLQTAVWLNTMWPVPLKYVLKTDVVLWMQW